MLLIPKRWNIYWSVVRYHFINSLSYRTELLIWVFLDTLPTLLLFFVWQAIFASTPQVNGYTFSLTIEYYFYFLIITTLTSAHFQRRYVEEIREGKIDYFLAKPYSFLSHIFWGFVGNKSFYAVLVLPCFIFLVLISRLFFQFHFTPFSVEQFLQFGFLFIAAVAIEYILSLMIVLLGFWFEYAESLEHFKWLAISLFGGQLMPRALMPHWLRSAVNFSPFKYMYAVPIEIIQGKSVLQTQDMVMVASFIVVLVVMTCILWRNGRYKYSSAGG